MSVRDAFVLPLDSHIWAVDWQLGPSQASGWSLPEFTEQIGEVAHVEQ